MHRSADRAPWRQGGMISSNPDRGSVEVSAEADVMYPPGDSVGDSTRVVQLAVVDPRSLSGSVVRFVSRHGVTCSSYLGGPLPRAATPVNQAGTP